MGSEFRILRSYEDSNLRMEIIMAEIIIDQRAALELCGGYPDVLEEVMQAFHQESVTLRQEIEQYYEAGDWKNLHIKAHSLKNAAASVGALTLSEQARNMEYALRDGKVEEAKSMYLPMLACMEQTVNILFTKESE